MLGVGILVKILKVCVRTERGGEGAQQNADRCEHEWRSI